MPLFHRTVKLPAVGVWEAIVLGIGEGWDFLDGPVVKALHFQCSGMGLMPGQGTKIPHAVQHNQK